MANEADNLNIIGSYIVFFADALFVLAATTEAQAEEIEDEEGKQMTLYLASTFNIAGVWAQVLGDYILFKAAQLEYEDDLKSDEPFDEQGSRLNILISEAQVIIDVAEVQLAERAANIAQ